MNLNLVLSAMQDRGLSPEQLANACAVSRPTIERILDGRTVNPGVLTMADIALNLGLSLDEIMDMPGSQSVSPPQSVAGQSAELSNLYRAVIHMKDLWIKRLSIACAALVGWYMLCWLVDLANPSVGWVNLNRSGSIGFSRILVAAFAVAVVVLLIHLITRKNKSGRA